jgi:hypothetical protein
MGAETEKHDPVIGPPATPEPSTEGPKSEILTPSEIEALRNEGKRALKYLMRGREHLIG